MMTGIEAAKSLGRRGPIVLAEACAVTRPTIYNWDKIPAEKLLVVERTTGISRDRLRPDLRGLWTTRPPKKR